MKSSFFALLTALTYFGFARAGYQGAVEKYPVIKGATIQDLLLPTLQLGSGPKNDEQGAPLTDLNNKPLQDQWPERIQFDVAGIALGILYDIAENIKYKKPEDVKLLIIGSLAGNNYGLLGASEILSDMGFMIHIYLIQEEESLDQAQFGATYHVKQWLHRVMDQKKGGHHKNIIFENPTNMDDIDSILEDKCDIIKEFKRKILAFVKEGNYAAAEALARDIEKELQGSTALPTFDSDNIRTFQRVYDGISGASLSEWYFKVGGYYGYKLLAVAQSNGTLWSVDYCSGWKDDAVSIPPLYVAAGLKALIANGLIHIGGMKPFVQVPECRRMKHIVVIPGPLYDALTSLDDNINFKKLHAFSKIVDWTATLYNIVNPPAISDDKNILVQFNFRNIIVNISKAVLDYVVNSRRDLAKVNPYAVFKPFLDTMKFGYGYDDIVLDINDTAIPTLAV